MEDIFLEDAEGWLLILLEKELQKNESWRDLAGVLTTATGNSFYRFVQFIVGINSLGLLKIKLFIDVYK